MAALLIDSKITHTIGMISMKSGEKMSDEMKEKLQALWKHITYLIINKVSVISKSFLVLLLRQISIAKELSGRGLNSVRLAALTSSYVVTSTSLHLSPCCQLKHCTIQPILHTTA